MSWLSLVDILVNFLPCSTPDGREPPATEEPPATTTIDLDEDDNGRSVNLRVLDLLAITLPANPKPGLKARLVPPDPKKLLVFEDGTAGPWHRVGCRPLARGESRIEVQYLRDDDAVESTWTVCLSVKK